MANGREIHRFDSTRVRQATYDEGRREIIVTFTDNVRWRYVQVPKSVWTEFIQADSAGKFLNETLTRHYANHGV